MRSHMFINWKMLLQILVPLFDSWSATFTFWQLYEFVISTFTVISLDPYYKKSKVYITNNFFLLEDNCFTIVLVSAIHQHQVGSQPGWNILKTIHFETEAIHNR